MAGENNKANAPSFDTFGDLTIKDLTGISTCNTFSEQKVAPTAYVESQKGATGTNYSHQELDTKAYPTELPPV